MARQRPDFGIWKGSDFDGEYIELSESYINKIQTILNIEKVKVDRFLAAARRQIHFYGVISNKGSVRPQATSKTIDAARKVLLTELISVLPMLRNQIGGARPFLEDALYQQGPGYKFENGPGDCINWDTLLDNMPLIVKVLIAGLNEAAPSIEKYKPARPRDQFVYEIAVAFKVVLGIKPTGYCSDDIDENRGDFAKVLAACFEEAIGSVPGDLPKLVKFGAKSVKYVPLVDTNDPDWGGHLIVRQVTDINLW